MGTRRETGLTTPELHDLLDEQHTVAVATIGPDGRPHLTSMWCLREGPDLLGWTYASSQKVHNLSRDPRATLMVEAGATYSELRGACLECEVDVVDSLDEKLRVGAALSAKFADRTPGSSRPDGVPEVVRAQAPKRVVLRFRPRRVRSWDHRKLTAPQATSS